MDQYAIIEHKYADLWIAHGFEEGFDYCYGGTRMVAPATSAPEVHSMLFRLMREESACKNALINFALENGASWPETARMPRGFLASRVGGARCVIRPKDERTFRLLHDTSHPEFEVIISSLFEQIGQFLNKHDGKVKLTPDFGRFAGLADLLAEYTPHVLGIQCDAGGCGGKSSYTVTGILAALESLNILQERTRAITLIGSAGALGSGVLDYFVSQDFPDIAACDLVYDNGMLILAKGIRCLRSSEKSFTPACLQRGGVIIATTFGEELQNSPWQVLPAGTQIILAHNLSVPSGKIGFDLMRKLHRRGINVIPGQILTLGGALTSRLEWFWRQSKPNTLFDKELAHTVVRSTVKFLLAEINDVMTSLGTTPYEAMVSVAGNNIEERPLE